MNNDLPPPSGPAPNQMLGGIFQAHPWHGVALGAEAPVRVNVFVEVVPGDTVKYELDKVSGHLKVDRPQLYSNTCPMPYGLVPQTLCGPRVAARCMEVTGRVGIVDFRKDGAGGPGPPLEERIDPEIIRRDAAAAGLTFLREETFLRYQYLLIFGK